MDRGQQLFVQIGEKWRDEFRRRIAVDRVHVDRDPRGLSVGAVQHLDARDTFVPQFRHGHFSMIAGKNFVEWPAFLLSHHDGGQESIALN